MTRLSGEDIDHYMNLRNWSYRPESNRRNDLTRIAVYHLLTVAKMEPMTGIEPAICRLQGGCISLLCYIGIKLAHPVGVEPTLTVLETVVLP